MKLKLESLLKQAVRQLQILGKIASDIAPDIRVNRTKDKNHGDFATNLALVLAKTCGIPSWRLARLLVHHLPMHAQLTRIEIADPGFINFFMQMDDRLQIIHHILDQKYQFSYCQDVQDEQTLLETRIVDCEDPSDIQYAYARTIRILRQLQQHGFVFDEHQGRRALSRLSDVHEQDLITILGRYPEMIQAVAVSRKSRMMTDYLRELANRLHCYYNTVQLRCEDDAMFAARLCLLKAVCQVLHKVLHK